MFQTSNGELLINELAMRPHNSGHFTIDASVTSQFEQHLRAVLDLPLGLTEMTSEHAVMVNLLGLDSGTAFLENYEATMYRFPEAKIHTYGKLPRPGRKMGHVTVAGDDLETVKSRALLAAAVVSGS
jgi:5-(carboxyamino)imidazole ribonucleotide synthase